MAAQATMLTIQLCQNDNQKISKMCKIALTENVAKFHKQLIQLAKQKLRIKGKVKINHIQ